MYTFSIAPYFDKSGFDRLFEECKGKIAEGVGTYSYDNSDPDSRRYEVFERAYRGAILSTTGMVIEGKKDGHIITMTCCMLETPYLREVLNLFGQDNEGSRGYLYDSDFINAYRAFHSSNSEYTDVKWSYKDNASTDMYNSYILTRYPPTNVGTESKSFEGMAYTDVEISIS